LQQVLKHNLPVELAISGMLPHTKQGDKLRTKFRVYEDDQNPHLAQFASENGKGE
jgi:ribosomal protein L13